MTMTTALELAPTGPATAAEIRAQVNLIQEVMRAVMKEGTHYGTIPGTPKPTLYKAGSEKILSTFRIACDPEVEDLSIPDEEARFRVRAKGTSQIFGTFLGAGVGECSSSEEKYRWRAIVHEKEWHATPEDRRRVKFTRDGNEIQQVRTNPSDVANTILKMAKKRAQIDMTLTVTAASDVFAQDIEDLPEELRGVAEDANGKAPLDAPQRRSAAPSYSGPLPDGIVRLVKVEAKSGEGKKGPYTKFTITDSKNRKFSTFSDTLATQARKHIGSKAPLEVEYETSQYGNDLKGFKVWTPPALEAPAAAETQPATGESQPTLPTDREPGEEG
jgi:hypothetical protein